MNIPFYNDLLIHLAIIISVLGLKIGFHNYPCDLNLGGLHQARYTS